MEAWLGELRPYAGEPRGSAGWRLAKASWRLVRGHWTILQLVLLLSALWTAQTYWFATAGLHWRGDAVPILLANGASVLTGTCLLGAIAASADAALDGASLDLSAARAETRERLRPLLGWGVLSLAIWIGVVQAGRGLGSPALGVIALVVWYLFTFFAIPLAVLGGMGPGSALRESVQVARRHKRESFAAFVGLGFFGLLAAVPGTMLLTHASALHQESGRLPHLVFAFGLLMTFGAISLAVASKEAFAVMIVRNEIDELSPRDYSGKRLGRGAKVLRFCGGVALVFAVFGAMSVISKHDRAVVKEANSPGTNYTTEIAYAGDLPSGSAVVFRGRKIGEVLGSEQERYGLRVRFHVEPGFGPNTTPGELMVDASGRSPCLVLVPLGESPPGGLQF